MTSALIGYTGFVGSNLNRSTDFDDLYNSKNIEDIVGKSYDLVVCAGVSAIKWMANKEPEKDLAGIERLQNALKKVKAKQFILISTIDVYPTLENADEDFNCDQENHAYGKHRLMFEGFCQDNFDDVYIIRLPGLFGEGLKKNVIFDLLNDNCLEMINPKSSFQYYYLGDLWKDIQIIREKGVKLVNLFSEPVASADIISTYFPTKDVGQAAAPEAHYNLKTKHAALKGLDGAYFVSKEDILRKMGEFIAAYGE